MADVKFDQFENGAEMRIGDQPVGLRPSDLTKNFIFDFPGTGIKDGNGNYLFQYATAGASAVNYLRFINSAAGQPVVITSGGSDANVSISINPLGTGEVFIPADVSQITRLDVDNIRLDGNTISATNIDGGIALAPNGAGTLVFDGLIWPISDGINGQFLMTDGAGNLSFESVPGGGTVSAGLENQIAYYPANGDLVDGLATANNGVLVTDVTGAPSISGTLPNAVQDNITRLGLIASGMVAASGQGLRTNVNAGNTALLQAYDVDGSAYVTFATLTANNTPTFDLNAATTLGGNTILTTANAITSINVRVFPSSATYTPSPGMKYCDAYVTGAGASGGGAQGSGGGAQVAAGGGGGAGGTSILFGIPAATIGASQSVTVGTGGAAPTAGNNAGNAGGASSLGAIITANGGAGGQGSATTPAVALTRLGGGGGAAGSGGSVNQAGSPGGVSILNGTSTFVNCGQGGASYWGGGGNSTNLGNTNGAAGTAAGSGGAGGNSTTANTSGGAGANGVVVIVEYI